MPNNIFLNDATTQRPTTDGRRPTGSVRLKLCYTFQSKGFLIFLSKCVCTFVLVCV